MDKKPNQQGINPKYFTIDIGSNNHHTPTTILSIPNNQIKIVGIKVNSLSKKVIGPIVMTRINITDAKSAKLSIINTYH